MFNNIPEELRLLPQFVAWHLQQVEGTDKPSKIPYDPKFQRKASVSNSDTWGTFEQACEAAKYLTGIGFVFTKHDPYAVIDLDYTEDVELQAKQAKIAEAFNSYAEISPSQKGLHIIVKGSIPCGRRKGPIEMYSTGRYMTFTGNVYKNLPIVDCQELLMMLWEDLGEDQKELIIIEEKDETQTDYEILKAASEAVNGQKFIDLYEGDWQKFYPSQSEADFALVDIIAYYTQNKNQITRIFRSSQLGKRAKALRHDYCNKMINRAFDNQLQPINFDSLRNSLSLQLSKKEEVKEEKIIKTVQLKQDNSVKSIEVPPGLTGEIAKFIYSSAPRPVPEIAVTGALGLMSGIVGRCYNISGTGLNQYLLLLAPTGTGKESISSGIDKLMKHVIKTVPAAMEFIGPSAIASEQALIKYMSKTSNSFASVVGEFGLVLKNLCSQRANSNQIGLRKAFLELYNKSGSGNIYKPIIYSDREKNTTCVNAPAFSIVGESTPERFYETLTDEMIYEGLLPRFTMIEYHGNRPQLNENHTYAQPSNYLVEQISQICAYALQLNNGNNTIQVNMDSNALQLMNDFNIECDKALNHASNEIVRHLWNRNHVKALKLAALLAVGVNYINPVITEVEALWAIQLIKNDTINLLSKYETGNIGAVSVQNEQVKDVYKAIKKYLSEDWIKVEKYPGSSYNTHFNKVVPHSFISGYVRNRISFKSDKLGPVQALKTVLNSLIENGDIQEINVADKTKFNIAKNGKVYALINTSLI